MEGVGRGEERGENEREQGTRGGWRVAGQDLVCTFENLGIESQIENLSFHVSRIGAAPAPAISRRFTH
eukprot:759505-Hanusia_phi.AAC.3